MLSFLKQFGKTTLPALAPMAPAPRPSQPIADSPPVVLEPATLVDNRPTKPVFCANCQQRTPHACQMIDGEVIATCQCGRFLKFPVFTNLEDFERQLHLHWLANDGQLTVEKAQAQREEWDAAFKKMMGVA